MNYHWGTERRFNAYADYFRKLFGERVQKLTLNAGFTCPNRDGTIARGGCTYCDNNAFTPGYTRTCTSLKEQLETGISFHSKRYRKVNKFLAYYQSYSNTYAPLSELKPIYQVALDHPSVVGIVIGTRPDCIDQEKLNYFARLSKETYLVIEYGIESLYNSTLEEVNRGHTIETTVHAIKETARRGIRVGGHLIIGLPGETPDHWLSAVDLLNELPLHSLKFHQLQVIKGTVMEKQYQKSPNRFYQPGMEEYLQFIADITEKLNPDIVVERIAGEVNPGKSLKEGWGVRYDQVLVRFEEILQERDSWQGKVYETKTKQK